MCPFPSFWGPFCLPNPPHGSMFTSQFLELFLTSFWIIVCSDFGRILSLILDPQNHDFSRILDPQDPIWSTNVRVH